MLIRFLSIGDVPKDNCYANYRPHIVAQWRTFIFDGEASSIFSPEDIVQYVPRYPVVQRQVNWTILNWKLRHVCMVVMNGFMAGTSNQSLVLIPSKHNHRCKVLCNYSSLRIYDVYSLADGAQNVMKLAVSQFQVSFHFYNARHGINLGYKNLHRRGFEHDVISAGMDNSDENLQRLRGRDKYDGRPGSFFRLFELAELFNRLKPRHPWHFKIHKDQIGLFYGHRFKRLNAIPCQCHFTSQIF